MKKNITEGLLDTDPTVAPDKYVYTLIEILKQLDQLKDTDGIKIQSIINKVNKGLQDKGVLLNIRSEYPMGEGDGYMAAVKGKQDMYVGMEENKKKLKELLTKEVKEVLLEELSKLDKKLYEYSDIPRIYPELKKMIKNGQGDFKKFIRAFDMMDGEYDKNDSYEIRDAISDALDKSGTSFNYDKLTQLVTKTFK